jgi:hypothetical protein
MPVTYKDVRDKMAEHYIISDEGLVKLIFATVIANRMPVAPVWLFIIGASGSGKTMFMDAITNCDWIYQISSMTPNTFLSGFKAGAKEPSFLMTVPVLKGGIMIFKDFTTILSKRDDEAREILGQMREVYDGTLTKRTGQGDLLAWPGRLGLIAATTDAIYEARALYASMGERFIMYDPEIPNRKEVAILSMKNSATEFEAQEEIKKLSKEYLDETIQPIIQKFVESKSIPEIEEGLILEIADIADMTCSARSAVQRDRMSKEITHVYKSEMPTRLSKQLVAVSAAMMLMNGGPLTDNDKKILYKIGLDSIASSRRMVMRKLSEYDMVDTKGIAMELHYPTGTTRRWLEELTALGICGREDRKKGDGMGSGDRWYIKKEYRDIMAKYDNVKVVGGVLEAPEEIIIFGDDEAEEQKAQYFKQEQGNSSMSEEEMLSLAEEKRSSKVSKVVDTTEFVSDPEESEEETGADNVEAVQEVFDLSGYMDSLK